MGQAPERRILIVGVGRVGAGLLAAVPPAWSVALVDVNAERLAAVEPTRAAIRVVGDASSRLVLERCGLTPTTTAVVATRDDAVNAEVARLLRDEHQVQDVIVVTSEDTALPSGVDRVSRAHAVLADVRGRIPGLAGGGERGEMLQVPVLAGSAVIGRRLRDLHPGDWLVAMVYRGEALVVPHGDTVIAEGDRVLIVGDPGDLGTVGAYFRGGQPTFPAAWGAKVGFTAPGVEAAARWLVSRTTASDAVPVPDVRDAPDEVTAAAIAQVHAEDIGCLVVPERPIGWTSRVGLTRARWPERLHAVGVPVLVVRGAASPERIVVAVGSEHDSRAIGGVGLDLARQAGLPLVLLTVLPPDVSPDADVADDGTREVARMARLHGVEPTRIVDRGNPIERIRAHLGPSDLLVVGHSPARRNSVFSPDVSLFLLHATPGPALFVPWTRSTS